VNKILITGVAGFIGFHLALALKMRGIPVVGCDNFEPYYSVEIKKRRAELLQNSGVKVTELDICEGEELREWIEEEKPSHIVHLAAQAGVRHSLTEPEPYLRININGFFQVLEAVRAFPHIPLIYASSSSVYGHNKKIPFSETDPVDNPANLYAATKISDELLARTYHNLFGLTVWGLRFFTAYGPWGRPDMAYFSFAQALKEKKPLRLHNGGEMARDFTYIDDIVEGVISATERADGCEVINLGRGKPESVHRLVSLLADSLNEEPQLEMLPMQAGEVLTTYADITKAKKLLDYKPQISLEEGIAHFIKWFKEAEALL
jgi:UDP-glucuronate 4-epimerase